MGYCLAQLFKSRCTSRAVWRLVDATRQPYVAIGVREGVNSVNQDGRRSVKAHACGLLDRFHLLMTDAKVGPRGPEDGEAFVGDFPVRATVEVLQGDVHMATLDLIAHCKVKRYPVTMLIGELADAVGVTSQTIRFYEREGLLPEPRRAANGYRDYDDAGVSRAIFIRSAQSAGLTLAEVGSVIDVRDDGDVPCQHVIALLGNKLAKVRARQAELAALEAELEHLIARGNAFDPADCADSSVCTILAAPVPHTPLA